MEKVPSDEEDICIIDSDKYKLVEPGKANELEV